MRGVHGVEEAAGEHRSALIRLRRGEIAGLTGSGFFEFIHRFKDCRNELFKLASKLTIGILF